MKKLMLIFVLALSVIASQVVFAQEKPAEQKVEKAEKKAEAKEKKAEKKEKKAKRAAKKAAKEAKKDEVKKEEVK
jgi:hypothetical protein